MPLTGDRKREYQRNWRAARRLEWIIANGPCAHCFTWDDLEVDHKDPKQKLMDPERLWSLARDNPVRVTELAKCQVLCSKCHDQKTEAQHGSPVAHGTVSMYRYGCRCIECNEVNTRTKRERYRRASARGQIR